MSNEFTQAVVTWSVVPILFVLILCAIDFNERLQSVSDKVDEVHAAYFKLEKLKVENQK